MWDQIYDPLHSKVLSTIAAAIPVVTLLLLIATNKVKAHFAAIIALVVANLVAILIFTMPAGLSIRASILGAVSGFFPIGWIVLNVIFMYQLTLATGRFEALKRAVGGVTPDRRLQLLLIAFSFGAFFEGASGFGTPVAITGAILIGLGFSPLAASGLSLIANTAPVAYGALGTPIQGLASVTGLDPYILGAMVGRQLPVFSLIVPFWVVWAFAGWKGMKEVWPAILVTGVSFAIPQFVISNYINPWIVDIGASLISMGCLIGFLKIWQPRQLWLSPALRGRDDSAATAPPAKTIDTTPLTQSELWGALLPWIILCIILLIWGTGWFKNAVNPIFTWNYPVPDLHNLIRKVAPVAAKPTPEGAVFAFQYLSFTGTGMLIAAIISGLIMGLSPGRMAGIYGRTIKLCAYSLITISAMLAIGTLTRLSGLDATLGLAFAATGVLYPFFGTLLGWLGVALTGSDTSSNILFGNLQKITSEQLGLSPILMGAANSSGGVMGKMIDAQSIVVASTATNWFGHEGTILRFVFWHSIVLACLVGLFVMLQAYVHPFSAMVLH
ncbi:L-lactate permease [Bradyrhizobium sp. U87765 SZCCT0131]|uniref:L-lactate permease n=1 Tax=unclassified Bradyrhizobium TaxID=2631580 RepID=UPI001BAC2DCF|nr:MULTISPECIES: L-lactate permease [unclassified Bradyrhizobium]MBR1220786.1 L-lactate permease [Bradyrhizobium sp. U87765 SZCCT0131]MBR1260394.1 L-lactate permease [Bradyrhizobium sp. U87765 SZCCT0134]MBR1307357.1 L-lactate permease [Bradyrhizobium sp. U87765 SZCCT0110]MBR1321311.1 L-lactate permease [Bradyrhizobium sp. U87765 SZCCT0109]MBR1349624.1 L-lactate permease [Bradyrhizobium sp. U87765 SZCCT0048]